MEKIKLTDVQRWTGAKKIGGDENLLIDSISTDTRTLKKGEFFIPLKGENFDGHDYIEQAISKGACGFVYEEGNKNIPEGLSGDIAVFLSESNLGFLHGLAYNYIRMVDPVVIGITGSVGKTTTKDILVSILKRKHRICFTPKNYNNQIGVPKSILEVDKSTEYFVAELAMRDKGQIKELAEMIDIDLGIITAVGESHLEFFDDISQIALAKAEIAHGLEEKGGSLFLNHDNQWTELIKEAVGCRIIEFGKGKDLDYNFIDESADPLGRYTFLFCKKGSRIVPVRLNIPGYHNIYNGCAAAAVSHTLGIDKQDIKMGIEEAAIEGNRMEVFEKDGKIVISDCYNASPLSVSSALDTLTHISKSKSARSVAILSDMLELGKDSALMHYTVGEGVRKKNIDLLLSFGNLAKNICDGCGENSFYFKSKQKLLENIGDFLKKGDVVLVKGSRANKMEDIIKRI